MEPKQETEQHLKERFDKEVRKALLQASNEYRQKKGPSLITEEEMDEEI